MSAKKLSIAAAIALLALVAFVWWQSTQVAEAPVVVPQQQGFVQGATATGKDGTADNATAYTLSDVALHATKESCWASVNGTVYDLTLWVTAETVATVCGRDATSALQEQEEALKGFRVGVLVEVN